MPGDTYFKLRYHPGKAGGPLPLGRIRDHLALLNGAVRSGTTSKPRARYMTLETMTTLSDDALVNLPELAA